MMYVEEDAKPVGIKTRKLSCGGRVQVECRETRARKVASRLLAQPAPRPSQLRPGPAFIPWASSGEPTGRGGAKHLAWTLDKSLSGLT